ncbi:MAG: hypothetical protein E6J63_19275 [Deltaproteobacteria bacterium]|nr:MAG: hypothetical protein E6J63_19275 [Deltaproteobacteria bacterium]
MSDGTVRSVFIGHYGVSFAAKKAAPSLSLTWLFLAVQGLDILFACLVLAGVEHLRIVPGFTAYNPYELYDMPISHSLLGALVWAFLASLAARAVRLPWKPAALIGIAVFSHFILDVPVHTPDLPLAWRGTPKIGLGLWNHRAVALALELIALGAGLFLYVRGRTQLRARFWIFAVTLVAVALSTPFMPPPASPAAFAVQALSAYLALAVWAGWVEQPDRPPQPSH